MKKIFTLLVSAFLFTMAMAQAPTAEINKASVAPKIDGIVDDVWAEAQKNPINKVFVNAGVPEKPTVGNSWWKALWNEDGIYLLTYVEDDVFVPAYKGANPGNSWMYDKLEVYFDCNYVKIDGLGASAGKGHYQFAPTEKEALVNGGTGTTETDGSQWAFNASDAPHYYEEQFFPFSKLLDKDGTRVDLTEPIGFDVNIMDNDILTDMRNRMDWANDGSIGENWSNMDGAGLITLLGAEAAISIDEIHLNTGGTITANNGTLQMTATIVPANATIKDLKWSVVNGTGQATIDSKGLLTALTNGTVSVKAAATDGMGAEAMVDVVITNQQISRSKIWNSFNLIKNWNLDTDVTSWGNWVDGATAGQLTPAVADGVATLKAGLATDGAAWHYQFNQSPLAAESNVPYVLSFKSWATADAPAVVDFESAGSAAGGEQYNRYGISIDAEAVNGRSEWNYKLTTKPTWYTFHVTFDQIVPATVQKVQYMLSLSNETVSLDSVLLVPQTYYDLLATLPKDNTAAKSISNSINRVYPNPVGNGNSLFVELSSVNAKVAIYNAVGQKLMEKVATGNLAKFDVSGLRKGLYFIKLGDGSIQKFIR